MTIVMVVGSTRDMSLAKMIYIEEHAVEYDDAAENIDGERRVRTACEWTSVVSDLVGWASIDGIKGPTSVTIGGGPCL